MVTWPDTWQQHLSWIGFLHNKLLWFPIEPESYCLLRTTVFVCNYKVEEQNFRKFTCWSSVSSVCFVWVNSILRSTCTAISCASKCASSLYKQHHVTNRKRKPQPNTWFLESQDFPVEVAGLSESAVCLLLVGPVSLRTRTTPTGDTSSLYSFGLYGRPRSSVIFVKTWNKTMLAVNGLMRGHWWAKMNQYYWCLMFQWSCVTMITVGKGLCNWN